MVKAEEWHKGPTEAIRRNLPAGFDPTQFLHCTNGDMVLIWDDEKKSVPPAPEVPPAPAPMAASEPAPVETARDIPSPPPVIPEVKPEKHPVGLTTSVKKSKKK